jgi:hypothetical protein
MHSYAERLMLTPVDALQPAATNERLSISAVRMLFAYTAAGVGRQLARSARAAPLELSM